MTCERFIEPDIVAGVSAAMTPVTVPASFHWGAGDELKVNHWSGTLVFAAAKRG